MPVSCIVVAFAGDFIIFTSSFYFLGYKYYVCDV